MEPIDALQERIAHQELALEALTRALLEQEARTRALAQEVQRLAETLRRLEEQGGVPLSAETERPPHY